MSFRKLKAAITCIAPALIAVAGLPNMVVGQECPFSQSADGQPAYATPAQSANQQLTNVAFTTTTQTGEIKEITDIVDTAVAAGKFKTLVAAVKAAGLVETLKGPGPFTVFAPSDDAFAKIPEEKLEDLLKPENKEVLTSILTYHVVGSATVMASEVVTLPSVKTVNGQEATILVMDGKVKINDANVIATDIECTNGVIHVIDSVLMPKKMSNESGSASKESGSASKEAGSMTKKPDIVDTAVSAGNFNTLVAAVKAAGLVETLKSEGPFTVFAPSDDAFAKVPAETLQELLKPENKEKLTSILTYHVVSGKVMAADVVELESAKTVNGQEVAIKAADGKVTVDGANVVATDIECGNGVIHVIDAVIMPK